MTVAIVSRSPPGAIATSPPVNNVGMMKHDIGMLCSIGFGVNETSVSSKPKYRSTAREA